MLIVCIIAKELLVVVKVIVISISAYPCNRNPYNPMTDAL